MYSRIKVQEKSTQATRNISWQHCGNWVLQFQALAIPPQKSLKCHIEVFQNCQDLLPFFFFLPGQIDRLTGGVMECVRCDGEFGSIKTSICRSCKTCIIFRLFYKRSPALFVIIKTWLLVDFDWISFQLGITYAFTYGYKLLIL